MYHGARGLGELTVVIPVKDEEPRVVERLLADAPPNWEVIIVDDGSRIANPHATIRLPKSLGYGAALKSGIRVAKHRYVATMDGDGQHRFRDVERLWEFYQEFPENAMVVGDRRLREYQPYRWVGRKVLNMIASCFAGRYIPDLNSGLRIFNVDIMRGYEPILADGFSFTTSLALSFLADGYQVDYLPIRVLPRTVGQTKVKLVKDGWTTLKYILRIGIAMRTRTLRRLWRSWKHAVWTPDKPCDCYVCARVFA